MQRLRQHIGSIGEFQDHIFQACVADVQKLTRTQLESATDIVADQVLDKNWPAIPEIGEWTKYEVERKEHGSLRFEFGVRAPILSGSWRWLDLNRAGLKTLEAYVRQEAEIIIRADDVRNQEAIGRTLKQRTEDVGANIAAFPRVADELRRQLKTRLTPEIQKVQRRHAQAATVFDSIPFPIERWKVPGLPLVETTDLRLLTEIPLPRRIDSAEALKAPPHSKRVAIEADAYFQIIDACMSMSNTIVRNPSTFSRFWSDAKNEQVQETPFRDILLLGLNGTFKGGVTGETFNGQGKSDILVKVDDRILFIAECKVWKGEASYLKAIQQLLELYVTADTPRVAVIMFVGNKRFADAVRKFRDATATYPQCRNILVGEDGRQIRWEVPHPADPSRPNLVVTSIAMHVPNELETE